MTPATAGVNGASPAAGDPLRANLALMAPGTALRDGLERILRGRTGALVVLGYDRVVESLCTGGFSLDVEFSATRLRELCKMDGAVVLSSDGTRIVRAAVHLMPDPSIPSEESGTRHRTAERVAKQTGHPVISVSQSMRIIGLYVNGQRHVLDDSAAILSRANQALATLERYKLRLDEVSGTLSALEIEDLVTVRDAVAVVQRLEMVRRIADEIAGYVVELGTDGRLLALQLDELMAGVDADRTLVIRDYLPSGRKARTLDEALVELDLLGAGELIDLIAVAKALGYPGASDALDAAGLPGRLPAAGQGATPARAGGRSAGRAFRQSAAAVGRHGGGPAGGRWGGRRPRPRRAGRPVTAG
jgi:diadenylate cyclase